MFTWRIAGKFSRSDLNLYQEDEQEEGEGMNAGREHAERRAAQAAAARKPKNKARSRKYPGKGDRNNWKKEV